MAYVEVILRVLSRQLGRIPLQSDDWCIIAGLVGYPHSVVQADLQLKSETDLYYGFHRRYPGRCALRLRPSCSTAQRPPSLRQGKSNQCVDIEELLQTVPECRYHRSSLKSTSSNDKSLHLAPLPAHLHRRKISIAATTWVCRHRRFYPFLEHHARFDLYLPMYSCSRALVAGSARQKVHQL